MWRERRWSELLILIDWLPRNSAFMQAVSEDEEYAEQVLAQPESSKKGARNPAISEWSSEVEKLTDIVDRLGEVMQAVVASAGGKPPKVRPQPRPKTAIDKLRERKRHEHHRKVVSRVLIQQEDGSLTPISIGAPPPKKQVPPPVRRGRPAMLPGEDPYRLKAPRRKEADEGPATGEPRR